MTKIAKAKSSRDIRTAQKAYEDLKVARLACQIQLRATKIPFSCYQTLELERKMGIYSSKITRAQILQKLDAHCLKVASNLQVGDFPINTVSPTCRAKVALAQRIQRYRQSYPSLSDSPGPDLEMN